MGSLPVPIVQALAATSPEVPPRYIRPDAEAEPVSLHGGAEIPVVDFSRLLDPHFSQQESARLDEACEQWGFFQLVNHSIPAEVIEKVKVDIEDFFKLPLEKKKEFSQTSDSLEGYGQLFVVSEYQKLDWADMLFFNTQPISRRSTRFWPTIPNTFGTTLDMYSLEVNKLANSVLHLMAKNLGLDPEKATELFKNGIQSVRINYYPPCPQANKVLGFSPHSDGSAITLVLQVNQVQGLEIKKNGQWVPVKPLPGAFVVNVGDCFEILSNGRYKSIEHRVVVNTEKERLSIAAFHGPNSDAVIGPFDELIKGGEVHYKTLDYENYRKLFFSAKLEGKNFLDRLKVK